MMISTKILGAASAMIVAMAAVSMGAAAAENAGFGRCQIQANTPAHALKPTSDGVLTIAVPLPSPQAYEGNTPDTISGGYLYCLGAEIAHRGGLSGVRVKNASFESLVTGKSKDFDMSIWDLFATPERKKSVDFSTGYRATDSAVATKAGGKVSAETIKQARIGVLLGSLQEKFVRESIKPDQQLRLFQSNDDMWAALMANQIDAALADTETAMPRAKVSEGRITVVGRYPVGGDVAILFPKGSANVASTDAILEDMRKDGSLKAIEHAWLAPILGGNASDIPEWKVP